MENIISTFLHIEHEPAQSWAGRHRPTSATETLPNATD